MGLFQDEAFSDALKLALTAGVLSSSMHRTIPVQIPLAFFVPPSYDDSTNPTTTKPFTTVNQSQSIQGLMKTLQPPYVTIPLHMFFPVYDPQAQVPPPQRVLSPRSLISMFWDMVRRTAELSAHGAVALARLFSLVGKAAPKKNLACFRDDQQPPLCDSLDLSSLPSIPAEDDLLRLDMTVLESIPASELYVGEAESVTTVTTAPKLLSAKTMTPTCPHSGYSDTTLATILGGSLPSWNLSALLQIPDDELYFNFRDLDKLGATPPWPFNSSVSATPTLSST